jgi:hypothetical protein
MKPHFRRTGVALLAMVPLTLVTAGSLNAQHTLAPTGPATGVWLEMSHPSLKDQLKVTPTTSVWQLGGRLAFAPRFSGVVELPFSFAKFENVPGAEQSSAVGNPYLGAEFLATPQLKLDFGGRIPIDRSEKTTCACAVAMIQDPMRVEAFSRDWLPISGGLTLQQATPFGLDLRARAGMTGMFYTGSQSGVDPEASVDYAVFGSYPVDIARFGLGFAGRWWVTEDEGNFSDNSMHQVGLTADVLFAGMRPGVTLRLPIDKDWRQDYRHSVGFYLQVPLR